MRLVNRILVVCAGATLPAVVAVIGCAVDSDRFPGIQNDVPNAANGGEKPTSTTSSSSSSSTSSTGGEVPTLCQCAATFVMATDSACKTCANDTINGSAGGDCADEQQACDNNDCSTAIACVVDCAGDATCIAGCITSNPAYQELLNCQCNDCAADCSVPNQPVCNLGGGTGGAGGGGTGGSGTGGASPDAGDGG
jgi:hypothetical protein